MFFQAVEQHLVAGARRSGLIQNDDIYSAQLCSIVPERLPDYAFQAISADRRSTVLFADSKPQLWLGRAIGSVENGKHFVAAALSFLEYAAEGGLVWKSARAPEAIVRRCACCYFSFRELYQPIAPRYGESFALPLARRRFNTRRPAFVAIRDLNPWVRARFRVLG